MNEPQPKPKGGRPKFEATPNMRNNVELLSGAGLAQDKIAIVVGCSERTLQSKFRKELSRGSAKLEALCVTTQVKALAAGGTAALRASEFLLRCRFGWSQYAAPSGPAKEAPKGKKEMLNEAAAVGHEATSWGEMLN